MELSTCLLLQIQAGEGMYMIILKYKSLTFQFTQRSLKAYFSPSKEYITVYIISSKKCLFTYPICAANQSQLIEMGRHVIQVKNIYLTKQL